MLHEKKGIPRRSKSVHQHQQNLNEHLQDIFICREGEGDSGVKRSGLELGTCGSYENNNEKLITAYTNLFHLKQ